VSIKNPPPLTRGASIGEHWHATYKIFICGNRVTNFPTVEGELHSHGDGFMHMHPFSAAGAGSNANVGLFYSQAGDKVSAGQVKFAKQTYKNGDTCDNLDKKPGLVRWSVNGQEKTGNPGRFVPNNRDVVAIAFLPKGVDIGTPPVATAGANPSDVSQ
jgi:hypothetical protein